MHHVDRCERSEADAQPDVADDRSSSTSGLTSAARSASTCALKRAVVSRAEEHAPREVRVLDDVHVDDRDSPDADEREVLDDLVAERPGADDQNARSRSRPGPTR